MSNEEIKETIIGKLSFHNYTHNVQDLLRNGTHEIINLNVKPVEIIVLPNNFIISSNYEEKNLTLYDENFNLIKTVETLNKNYILNPYGISVDMEEKRLFISEKEKNKILMTDFEFNEIKVIGTCGAGNQQFNNPCGIHFKTNHLYICDKGNKRLQIYSKDLDFVNSLKLDFEPWTTKASNLMLSIESAYVSGIWFYKLSDLSFYRKYDNGFCRISEINFQFYEFNFRSKKIICYDNNGDLNEEIFLNRIEDDCFTGSWDGVILNLNGNVIMTCYHKKRILKFLQS